MRIINTCNAVNNGKYKSGSSYFPVGMAPSTLGIICRPSNAAMKYVYKTKVTTYEMRKKIRKKTAHIRRALEVVRPTGATAIIYGFSFATAITCV